MAGKIEEIADYKCLSDILKRATLGNNVAEDKIIEIKQTFFQPSGTVADITISEATAKFMNEYYPEFGEKSLSFPEQAVDYGLSTQAMLLTDNELVKVEERLDNSQKCKFVDFMKTKVKKGKVSEIEVFNFAKKCENKLLMAVFWSFDQSCLHRLIGTEKTNQEMDIIILLAKQRKFIVIEVKSDHSRRVPSNALTTLKHAKTFADKLFNILGIKESEQWEYIPFVALPNVESRDRLHHRYHSHLHHILTQTELKTDLLRLIKLNEDEYDDVSSYKTILSLLAASYHANAVKKNGFGGIQFTTRNLVLEASRKLVGEAQIQAGFDASDKLKDKVSFTDLKNTPLAGFKGFMFWNKEQIEILMNIEKHEKAGRPCVIAGPWGTGKTLLLAYTAIKLSSEDKKVVFISNLDSKGNMVIAKHFVFEEKVRMDFELNTNISFLTMKDIIKDIAEQNLSKECILLQFIRKRVEAGSCHIIIDELDVDSNPSLLADLQGIQLGACSLTVALRGDTRNVDEIKLMEGRLVVLKKIMRMSTQVYETITNLSTLGPMVEIPIDARPLFKNSTAQHTVLGCNPELIIVSNSDELKTIGLKEALLKVSSHPAVVILCTLYNHKLQENILSRLIVEDIKVVVEVIKANTSQPALVFTGATSEREALRGFLRNPSGFLVTTPDLFSGMEATSVIVILNRGFCHALGYLNGLVRATTSLIFIIPHMIWDLDSF